MNNNKRPCKILIVEDEAPVRFSIRSYLDDLDYLTIEAENGRIGLEMFRSEAPDLILLDLRMPEMDGLELLSCLKVEAPDTPAIVVSGTGKIGDAIEALRVGAWDYVLKPIRDMEVLRYAIDKALERARLLAENQRHKEDLEELVEERTRELQNEIIERRNVEKALRESEERYRTLIDTASEGVWAVDLDGRTTFVNRQMASMLGYTTDEMLDRLMYDFMDDANRALLKEKMLNRQEGKGEQYDLTFLHKDGANICCIINASPLFNAEDQVVGSFGMITNVTERQRLLNRLQLAQRMEAIGTLAGGIAHDFNNILGAIIGYADLMEFHLPGECNRIQPYLQGVKDAGERAKKLVEQILIFSRQTKEERKPILLELIVKESIKFLRASIPTTIEMRQHIETRDSIVLADATQMHQVLMNLCTNAAQAMKKEGGTLEITLSDVTLEGEGAGTGLEKLSGPFVQLVVSDTGKGIHPEHVERIFDPFFTTKQPGEGTGMGLSVVHGIVSNHGGSISVKSEPGRGTEFVVLLPRKEHESIDAAADESMVLARGTETVLVVDDEEVILDVLEQALSYLGYTVVIESNSLGALETFKSRPNEFDLVITDMTMPGLTGLKLASELLGIRKDIPVILCTGYCDNITAEEAKGLGLRELLHKPLDTISLAARIRQVLDGGELRVTDSHDK